MKSSYIRLGRSHILYDGERFDHIDADHFSFNRWQQRGALVGSAMGRGTAAFVRDDRGEMVLRHYRRGGMVARLLNDCYLWRRLEQTRPWREWRLLQTLREQGLPVPRPLGVRVERRWYCYRGDLLMERIAAPALGQRLGKGALTAEGWQAIGRTVRRFHDAGVYHSDLNANNILFSDSGEVSIIDFDRGELRGAGKWQPANLERLLRSLRKLNGQNLSFYFDEATDWPALLAGYGGV